MKNAASLTRKILILLVGLPIIALGIILIPLPGPGLLVLALGLFILSLEFEWAQKRLATVKEQLKKITALSRPRNNSEPPKPK